MSMIADTVTDAQIETTIRKGWLNRVVRNMKKGQLHRDLGVPENKTIGRSKIEAAARSHPSPKVRERARFALKLMGFGHSGVKKDARFESLHPRAGGKFAVKGEQHRSDPESEGHRRRALHAMLRQLGYTEGSLAESIKAYQRDHDLPVTGKLGKRGSKVRDHIRANHRAKGYKHHNPPKRKARHTGRIRDLSAPVKKVETFSKPGTADVTPSDKKKIEPLARHYLGMDHPFTRCVADQVKHGLGDDHAKRRCAVLLDTFDPERLHHSRPAK